MTKIRDDAIVTIECGACGSKLEMSYADFKKEAVVIGGKFLNVNLQCIGCLITAEISVREKS